jgi:hypothetical protein
MTMKLEISYSAEHPRPYQRLIAEVRQEVHPKTGVIVRQSKTGVLLTRSQWNERGFFFPRWGQTITLARA